MRCSRKNARRACPRHLHDELGQQCARASPGWPAASASRPRPSCPRTRREAKLEKLRRLGARIECAPAERVVARDRDGRSGRSGRRLHRCGARSRRASPATRPSESRSSRNGPGVSRRFSFPSAAADSPAASRARCASCYGRDVKIIACELETRRAARGGARRGRSGIDAARAGFVSGVGFGTVLPGDVAAHSRA